jgi:hypothetical protein
MKNPIIRIFCTSGRLAVPINPDNWSYTVILRTCSVNNIFRNSPAKRLSIVFHNFPSCCSYTSVIKHFFLDLLGLHLLHSIRLLYVEDTVYKLLNMIIRIKRIVMEILTPSHKVVPWVKRRIAGFVLSRTFESNKQKVIESRRKVHSKDLNNLYSLPNITEANISQSVQRQAYGLQA